MNGRPLEFIQPEILRIKLQEPLLIVGKDKFAGLDIRIRVRGGGHVAQIYGRIARESTEWKYALLLKKKLF